MVKLFKHSATGATVVVVGANVVVVVYTELTSKLIHKSGRADGGVTVITIVIGAPSHPFIISYGVTVYVTI